MAREFVAYVSWPDAPLTESLVRRSLAHLGLSDCISSSAPRETPSRLLQWSAYDSLDHVLTNAHPHRVLASSYTIRKALIRKHFLSRCISSYVTKHPDSLLKIAIPRTWDLEISFADELDEMWSDDLFDLGLELDGSTKWWILKPGMADRGMGIRLFNSKETLQQIFESFEGVSDGEDEEDIDSTAVMTSQLRHFVVQEYMPTPLLLDPSQVPLPSSTTKNSHSPPQGHKFHLRAYCFASGALSVYLYTRILALFSAAPYTLPVTDDGSGHISSVDLTPHLTNTSLQTHRGEEGVRLLEELVGCNILSRAADDNSDDSRKFSAEDITLIQSQMADILAETFKAAVETPIHFQAIPNAFELYGVDFLVSHDTSSMPQGCSSSSLRVSLLEMNAEPAIELTGPRLTWILEDLFKVVGEVCVRPFITGKLTEHLNDEVEPSFWPIGEIRGNALKCLQMEVRGPSVW